MASVRQRAGTKFWFACFTLPNGKRVQRSTKETDRKKSQKIADEWEAVTRGRVTARQTQKVIADLYRAITGEHLVFPTVREYFDSWVVRKKPETAPSTYRYYHDKAQRFVNWLGNRADQQIALITRDDILEFRTAELARVAPRSVNHSIKFLRMVFKTAKEDGKYHDENPSAGVNLAKLRDATRRRGFTIPEIKRVLKNANHEWRSLIYFGLYTGQRLGDLARLTWQNVDLDRDEIRFVSRKTGRTMIIPIASPLRVQIENLPAGDDPHQPLHPRAIASVEKSGGVKTLSRQFSELLADAGLAKTKAHRKSTNGSGRDGRRELSQISFHSLRHTATSLMKNAGINASVVMDIIGHESEAISMHYTHIDEETKRNAIALLPAILGDRPARKIGTATRTDRGRPKLASKIAKSKSEEEIKPC
jgi:integrase